MATKKVYSTQVHKVLECFYDHGIDVKVSDCKLVADTIAQGYAAEMHGIIFQPIQTKQFSRFRASKEHV